jgi:Fe-S-cluster containining protein
LKFENVNLPDHIGFKCKNCGLCCKEQPADLNSIEINKIENKGFRNFLDEKDQTEPRLIKSKAGGDCFFLNDNYCEINELKPAICKLVPFVVMDWDYKKNIIEVDLPIECNCPGLFIGEEIPFEIISKAAQSFVDELLKVISIKENLPIADDRVRSKTRIRIIEMQIETQNSTT